MYLSLYVVSCAIDRVRGREEMHKEIENRKFGDGEGTMKIRGL